MARFNDRLRQLRQDAGLSQMEFSKQLKLYMGVQKGCSKSSINMYERGEREPGIETLEAIADYFNVDMDYLIGKSEYKNRHSIANNSFPSPDIPYPPSVPSYAIPNPFTNRVPRVGSVACGTPILAVENVEAYDLTPESWHADFTLVCKGDSMAPKIQDGDLVALRCQPQVERGQIAVALIDGSEATLKRVYVYPDHIELRAINPDFDSLIFFGNEMGRVRIEGLVVGICRRIVS